MLSVWNLGVCDDFYQRADTRAESEGAQLMWFVYREMKTVCVRVGIVCTRACVFLCCLAWLHVFKEEYLILSKKDIVIGHVCLKTHFVHLLPNSQTSRSKSVVFDCDMHFAFFSVRCVQDILTSQRSGNRDASLSVGVPAVQVLFVSRHAS